MNRFRSLICSILALSLFLTFSGCHQAYSPGYYTGDESDTRSPDGKSERERQRRQLPEGN
jgi:hypothetical protein